MKKSIAMELEDDFYKQLYDSLFGKDYIIEKKNGVRFIWELEGKDKND